METRVDPNKLTKTFKLLGFDNMQHTECRGYAGGIIVAWKPSDVQISVESADFQFMHLKIAFGNGSSWEFTAIYASPKEDLRKEMWTKLKIMSRTIAGGWMMAGDFNDIATQDEKKGGAPVSIRRCNNFLDNINDCNLVDLGAIGTKFTWRGAQVSGHDRIFERLDRALSNDEWRIMFPEAIVKVLPRIDFSDHHLILIMLQGIHHTQRKNKFRFEKAWMYHDTYKDLVKHQWNKNDALPHNISHMEVELNKWKRNVFGSIHKRKTDLMNRINGIQRKQYIERNNKFLE
jgi:hypothetical protein